MKIDKRVNYLIGLDTETCNSILTEDGKLDLSQSLVYDIGWQVCDKSGNVYEKRSFMIYEVFVGMKEKMKSAYYADKIPDYWDQLKSGQRRMAKFETVRRILIEDIKKYNVNNIFAHNARFDLNALNNTRRELSSGSRKYFFPKDIELWDTLKMARQTFGKEVSYRRWCADNGFMTNHSVPQPRMTAEVLYRYISGDICFEESHTGLEDVEIETEILVCCFRKHKKMEKRL